MGSRRVRHDWVTSLSLFTFMHWRRKWQPTPVFLPGESQGRGNLVGCHLWGQTESDTTEATWQQQAKYWFPQIYLHPKKPVNYYLVWRNFVFADVNWGPWEGKIILEYPGGPNVIVRVLARGKQKCQNRRKIQGCYAADFKDRGMGSWAKECSQPLETGKSKEMVSSLQPPEETLLILWF